MKHIYSGFKVVAFLATITWPAVMLDDCTERDIVKMHRRMMYEDTCHQIARDSKGTPYEVVFESCMQRRMGER